MTIEIRPIGYVESSIQTREDAPKQGDEGAPEAWLVFEEDVRDAMRDFRPGDEVVLVTWLDRADRTVLRGHPRGDPARPETGIFRTRGPHRPNPIGLHTIGILEVQGLRVRVRDLEAFDGTPILDVKGLLREIGQR